MKENKIKLRKRRRKRKRIKFFNIKIKRELDEVRRIRWIAEILKTLIIFILSVTFLYLIRKFSIGDFQGDKLQKYLEKQILSYIGANKIESQILYNSTYDILTDDSAIIVYSKYTIQEESKDDYFGGTNISIFERKDSNIINELFGTKPKYELMFCANCEGFPSMLNYQEILVEDWNGDGKYEFTIHTNSRFASRISKECIFISKNNDKWQIISPKSLNDVDDKSTNLDIFTFNDALNKKIQYTCFGVSNNGVIYKLKNPLNAAVEFCYIITKDNWNNGIKERQYLYSMQQYTSEGFIIDPNWNMEKTLVLDEPMDFENEQENYWGIQVEDQIFYREP